MSLVSISALSFHVLLCSFSTNLFKLCKQFLDAPLVHVSVQCREMKEVWIQCHSAYFLFNLCWNPWEGSFAVIQLSGSKEWRFGYSLLSFLWHPQGQQSKSATVIDSRGIAQWSGTSLSCTGTRRFFAFPFFKEIRSRLFCSSLFLPVEQQCGGSLKNLCRSGWEPK